MTIQDRLLALIPQKDKRYPAEFIRRLNAGHRRVPQSTAKRWFRERRPQEPKASDLVAISKAFGVSVDSLLEMPRPKEDEDFENALKEHIGWRLAEELASRLGTSREFVAAVLKGTDALSEAVVELVRQALRTSAGAALESEVRQWLVEKRRSEERAKRPFPYYLDQEQFNVMVELLPSTQPDEATLRRSRGPHRILRRVRK